MLSHVRLFETPWTVAHQAPLSIEFSRQEYWSGLPFPSLWDLPNPGIEPRSPALQADSFPSEPPGKPPQGWVVNPKPLSLSCFQRTLSSCISPLLTSLTLNIYYTLSLLSPPSCKYCVFLSLPRCCPTALSLAFSWHPNFSLGFASSWEPSLTPPSPLSFVFSKHLYLCYSNVTFYCNSTSGGRGSLSKSLCSQGQAQYLVHNSFQLMFLQWIKGS